MKKILLLFVSVLIVSLAQAQLVTSITINNVPTSITVGSTVTLSPIVLPQNALNQGVTWTSSNTSVATINPNGVVTTIGIGETVITATANDGSGISTTAVLLVTGIKMTGITLGYQTLSMKIGDAVTITTLLAPTNVTNKTLIWTSSNAAVASVDISGVVTAISPGTTEILATAYDGSGVKATCIVTVSPILITGITLSQTQLTLTSAATPSTLTATVSPVNATNKTITWSSSNTAIATVDQLGKITALNSGTAIITATAADGSGITATCSVNSYIQPTPTVTVSQKNWNILLGETFQLTATTTATSGISWSSLNPNIASVSPSGLVTANIVGETYIYATLTGTLTKDSCLVRVQQNSTIPVTSIVISQSVLQLFQSTKPVALYAKVLPIDATNKIIVWSSSNTAVITVSSKGEITPVGAGQAVVFAKTEDGQISAYCSVYVQAIQFSSIYIAPQDIKLQVSKTATIQAKLYPSPTTTTANTISWTSSNPNIATVDVNGVVTAIAAGTTNIVAAYSQATAILKDTCIVTVVDESLTIKKQFTNITIPIGANTNQTYKFADYFNYSGTAEISFTVTSGNNIVQTPVSGGSFGIIPLSPGTADVIVVATTKTGLTVTAVLIVTVTANTATQNLCSSLQVSSQVLPVNCTGANTGAAYVVATGGTAPYTYKWSNYRTDNVIKNMPAGSYSVIVTDSKACAFIKQIIIGEATPIELQAQIDAPSCGNTNGKIQVNTIGGSTPYTYIWNTGETTNTISDKNTGVYTVTITDNKGCTKTSSFELNNSEAPIISVNGITESNCNPNNGSIDISVTGGTGTYTYEWNDQNTSEDRTGLAAGKYKLQVTDDNGCKALAYVEVPAKQIAQPEISLVTVGETTGHNLIIWEKEVTDAIDFYTLYRETNTAGEFEKTEDISYNLPSINEDLIALPKERSYRYRISATDFCGNESPLSAKKAEYKTINAFMFATPDSVVLYWDSYEGFDFYSYIIYKKTPNGKVEIGRVPANKNHFVYQTTAGSTSGYYVAVELPKTLNPNGILKIESGPFTLALSNIAESQTGITETDNTTTKVFPTEVSSNITVSSEGLTEVSIVSAAGITVYNSGNISSNTIEIPVSQLTKGLYIVKVQNGATISSTPIIVK